METFSTLLAISAGNSVASGKFSTQRPATRSFDGIFDLCLNRRLSKQSWGWWFKTPSRPLWCQSNEKKHRCYQWLILATLPWHHNELAGVSNHQPHDCLLDRLFTRRSKKTSKLRVTGLGVGNSPLAGEFPGQRASNAENVSIRCHHHKVVDSL